MRFWIAMPPPIALIRRMFVVARPSRRGRCPARHEAALLVIHLLEDVQDVRDALAVRGVLMRSGQSFFTRIVRPRAGRRPGPDRRPCVPRVPAAAAMKFSQSPRRAHEVLAAAFELVAVVRAPSPRFVPASYSRSSPEVLSLLTRGLREQVVRRCGRTSRPSRATSGCRRSPWGTRARRRPRRPRWSCRSRFSSR